ncbi:MAG: 2-dehydropantoate 2-reductase [Thermodesulfobacteriota bacterium]
MRIAIVGTGALGSVLGGLLLAAGQDVFLVERDAAHVELIRKQGLSMEGVSGERVLHPPISTDSRDAGTADLVLVLVKAYDTEGATSTVEQLLGSDGAVLTLQNGVGNHEILDRAFPGRVMLGTTTIGALALAPGKVRHTGFGVTHLGEADGSLSERAQRAAEALRSMSAGDVHVTDNAVGCVWSKLLINAAINAPATLLRVRNGDLPCTQAGKELIHEIIAESLRIVQAKGVSLISDDPEGRVLAVCQATAGNICSMFQDILAGRRTEIDFINGALAREGDAAGIPTPVNLTLARLISALESTGTVRVP